LVAPKDSAIQHLRRVQEMAPAEIPKIGRAYLEDLLSMATAEGGFDRAARLQAEWQKLGPETKRILFPDLAHRAQLDHFFLLAKRLSDNPNPSGTAVVNNVFNWTAGLGGYPLSKPLYTS